MEAPNGLGGAQSPKMNYAQPTRLSPLRPAYLHNSGSKRPLFKNQVDVLLSIQGASLHRSLIRVWEVPPCVLDDIDIIIIIEFLYDTGI